MVISEPDPLKFLTASHELAKWMIQLADTKASILMTASAIRRRCKEKARERRRMARGRN